jgi:chromosome partitioning protein
LPSNADLAGAELELAELEHREQKLKFVLARLADKYRYLIIDCPPSLNLLTINAMTAANSVLIRYSVSIIPWKGFLRYCTPSA